ncbi:MAG: hypothetical protein APF81_17435 [Desulfosporosinus sp. BRH_c37]|nr:MAG: hypothetical protein APF81_17435 [Desulfosporosinus sp. BRH_c37]
MSFLDVYIGYSDDERFVWEGGEWSGNVPKRQSPFFPPKAPFRILVNKIESGVLSGKKVDWGAWATKVDKNYIELFFKESYSDDWYKNNQSYPHLIKEMDELKDLRTTKSYCNT